MSKRPDVRSFSLSENTINLLQAMANANERSMSAEVRHMIRARGDEMQMSPQVSQSHRARIAELAEIERASFIR